MEAMALESLVASVWKLEGFLSVVRHPIRVTGGYSDIDTLGIRADGCVRMAECKVRGPARCVYVDGDTFAWSGRWDDSLENVARIWDSPPPWLPIPEKTTCLEFHLVGNVWFVNPADRGNAQARLTDLLRPKVPKVLRNRVSARVFSSAELLTKAIRGVRANVVDDKWGKRYGDPLLDALRELVRYTNPRIKGARGLSSEIGRSTREDLFEALSGQPPATNGGSVATAASIGI